MTEEELYDAEPALDDPEGILDNPKVLLDAAALLEIRDATLAPNTGPGSRAYLKAQRDRLKLLQQEGYVSRIGPGGPTIFRGENQAPHSPVKRYPNTIKVDLPTITPAQVKPMDRKPSRRDA